MQVSVRRLTSWSNIHEYSQSGWIYRGQKDSVWDLVSSIERCFDRQDIGTQLRMKVEAELLRQFKRTFHHYSNRLPPEYCVLEWLSLMQHYGAPTRLLDFSYSIYVAAYFAVEEADSDSAIWAISDTWTLNETIRKLEALKKDNAAQLKSRFSETTESIINGLFLNEPFARCVCAVNPFRLNDRLRIQKGVFLMPGDLCSSFDANLKSMAGYDDSVNCVKLIIPKDLRTEAIRSLFDMNISRTNLFPGLDGFARSLAVYHPAINPDVWKEDMIREPFLKGP
jgi:hypothetical protein